MTSIGNLLYAQSGGVTSVINNTAAAVIETARKYPQSIGKVYAGRDGILGVLNEELIDTSLESHAAIRALRHTPSGAFGSCRHKLQDPTIQKDEFTRVVDVCERYNIRHILYNGGGDSADTCLKLAQQLTLRMGNVTVNHLPKTVDNDLPITDCSPGFGSVAKYIATSTLEASFDVASMARTSTKVFIIEVMGRHAGWIAAAGGLASDQRNKIPLLILFPEVPFDPARFVKRVDKEVKDNGYVSIVVSEGVRDKNGKFLSDQGTTDAFGHAQLGGAAQVVAKLVKVELGLKYHYAIADYLQRSARHISSKTDAEHAYSVGQKGVEYAVNGDSGLMPAIRRISDEPYRWDIVPADLTKIANQEKMLPQDFITKDGFGITDKARRYLRPLIEGEDYPPYQDGMPVYVQLKNQLVQPQLPTNWKDSDH